jgi:hypothetical protein
MMLAIAIISGIGMLLSIFDHLSDGQIDMNLLFPTILILSTWESCFPLAICTIVFCTIFIVIAALNYK